MSKPSVQQTLADLRDECDSVSGLLKILETHGAHHSIDDAHLATSLEILLGKFMGERIALQHLLEGIQQPSADNPGDVSVTGDDQEADA